MMNLRFAILPILFTPLVGCNRAPSAPSIQADVVCYIGKLDSGTKCSTSVSSPGDPLGKNGSLRCGLNEEVSTTQWSFVESRGAQDIYRFTRSVDGEPAAEAQSKEVPFDGTRVVVFEDADQVVVIQPLKQ